MGYFLLVILILGVIAMAIYFGSSKIGKVFVGSTEIGKVYHGSTLVFQNLKKLRLYAYRHTDGKKRYLIGSNSTSGVYVYEDLSTITNITGKLGNSGSTITVSNDTTGYGAGPYTYYQTLTFNGVKLYMYVYIHPQMPAFWAHYVIEDGVVGSKCMQMQGYCDLGDRSTPRYYPNYVTSTEMRYANTGSGYPRESSSDTNYTREGLKN